MGSVRKLAYLELHLEQMHESSCRALDFSHESSMLESTSRLIHSRAKTPPLCLGSVSTSRNERIRLVVYLEHVLSAIGLYAHISARNFLGANPFARLG